MITLETITIFLGIVGVLFVGGFIISYRRLEKKSKSTKKLSKKQKREMQGP